MTTANVPEDITQLEKDTAAVVADETKLAADDAAPVIPVPVPVPTPTPMPTPTPVTGPVPLVPSSLVVPTTLVFDDEFTGSVLKAPWQPRWFGNGAYQQGTTMESSNVSVGANGLELTLASNSTGAIVSTNPQDANNKSAGVGFQIAPTAGKPVYFEVEATLPGAASGQIANWPAFWMTGQVWPEDGEIDDLEGLSGWAAWHTHWGSGSADLGGQGANVFSTPGTHTFGSLWSTAGMTFVYDGKVVGTHAFASAAEIAAMAFPKFIVLENSLPRAGVDLLVPSVVTVRYVRVWT